jgi:hypothetical protein
MALSSAVSEKKSLYLEVASDMNLSPETGQAADRPRFR